MRSAPLRRRTTTTTSAISYTQLVSRYKGRIRYYQLWNEPNIYPEWGNYPISPEDYTRLLKIGATRAREADPNAVIIAGALASTIALQPDAAPPNNALNDLLFLQRMYDAGAAPYFDIMAMQAYGLWSGPTDRRMQPRVMNFGRPQFVRDLMVANGDANKPIWISEMAWNAVPDEVADKRFGQVSPEQQAAVRAAGLPACAGGMAVGGRGQHVVLQARHRRVVQAGQARGLLPAGRSRFHPAAGL